MQWPGKRRNQKELPTPKRGKKNLIDNYVFILSRVSSYFPMGNHSVTRYETVHNVHIISENVGVCLNCWCCL